MSNLIEISSNLGTYLTSLSPQIKEGSIQYYISGSLATMIMASAESFAEIDLDESNNLLGEKTPKEITTEQREKLAKFSRKLGIDIDVVNVNGDLFYGAPRNNKPNAQNVIKNVPEVLELMSWAQTMRGSMYIDSLEKEREITHHPIVRVKTQHGDIYVTAPPEQLAHKLSETIWLSSRMASGKFSDKQNANYKKDIKDLSSMFYGFKDLYDKDEFLDRVFTALDEKRDSLFSAHNSKYNSKNSIESQEILTKFIQSISDDSAVHLENIADKQTSTEIKDFFANIISKRKEKIEKLIHVESTPLQKKEAEVSSLEAEAKTISKAEALIDQQKEGQDIGEK